jgi:rhodanese-related sulfurtransferase
MKTILILLLALLCGVASNAQAPATQPASAPKAKSAVRNVTVEQFEALRRGTNAVVLDVRTQEEFVDGHLEGAVLLDYRAPDFAEKVAKLDKSKQYLVHCAAGGRSARACTKMESLGFTNLVNLEGGLGAWTDAGKPVVK